MLALAILIAVTGGGAAATYLYDDSSSLTTRLAAGATLGLAMLGLTGFVAASLLGFGPPALLVATALATAPLIVFVRGTTRTAARLDVDAALARVRGALSGRDRAALCGFGLFLLLAAPLVVLLTTVVYHAGDGIYTGLFVNRNDLPLHIDIIKGFVTGGNFPPQHPEFAGARLTYPFLVDFIAAQLMGAGLTLEGAVALENVVLLLALIVLLHRWALALTGVRAAAMQTPLLVLLCSGIGWVLFVVDAHSAPSGWLAYIWNLPYDYTMNTRHLQWGNVATTMIATQRSFLLGLPLFMIVWTLWWRAVRDVDARARVRSMAAAGVIVGCLPLVHTHSYMVAMGMAGVLSLVFWSWRAWFVFFALAVAIAVPQMLWVSHGSLLNTRGFIGWYPGWTKESENYVWFWFKNTGLFIPLLVAALAARRGWRVVPRPLMLFYAPFLLCFVAPQLFRFAPRITANMKILIYWYIASVPLVALLLAHLWQRRGIVRFLAVGAIVTLTAAASLDIWRVISGASAVRIFDAASVQFADVVDRVTPADAVILHAPTPNHPVFLTGRHSVLGNLLHVASHGLDYTERAADIARIYEGTADTHELLRRYHVDFVVVGPDEREAFRTNDELFAALPVAGSAASYRLYRSDDLAREADCRPTCPSEVVSARAVGVQQ